MRRKYFTDKEVAEAIKRYVNGETQAEIARDLEVDFGTVNRWLRLTNIERRPRPKNNWDNIKSLIK